MKDKVLSDAEKQEMLEQQAAREAKEEAAFQKLMREVFGGMAGTEGVMKDTTDMLTREKNNHDDKQAALYKQWEKNVFHNIQNQISKSLKKLSPDQISKKLRSSPKHTLLCIAVVVQLYDAHFFHCNLE